MRWRGLRTGSIRAMAQSLYTRDILRLAVQLGDDAVLTEPDGSAEMRAPICGSHAAVAVNLANGESVEAFSIVVNACAIGQASAAILKLHAAGLSQYELAGIRGQIAAFLAGEAAMPRIWPELCALEPAREYPARHGAVLLPYDALLAAMIDAAMTTVA